MTLPPERWLVLLLLALGGVGHGLALAAWLRRWPAAASALAGLAQVTLLAAMTGAGLLVLRTNDWRAWLPTRVEQTIEIAGWLGVLIFLIAGHWWRSPGLGVILPWLAGLLLALPLATRDALATRGLPIATDLRPAFGALSAVVLALVALALAGLGARWLEERLLGHPLLARRVPAVLLTLAAMLLSGQLALTTEAWLRRPRGAPAWTLQQTWLLAGWLVLLLATGAGWRGARGWGLLVTLAAGLLALRLAVVAGVE